MKYTHRKQKSSHMLFKKRFNIIIIISIKFIFTIKITVIVTIINAELLTQD